MSRLVDCCIELIDRNTVPPKLSLYQILEDELKAIKDTIDDYLACGWIRPATGSQDTPVIVIQKNTRELYIVIDYLLLNQYTRLDSYLNSHIDELLDCLDCIKYFRKIDLASGYHQTKIVDGHEKKTVFLTRYRIYEWLVLPLELTKIL